MTGVQMSFILSENCV